MLWRCRRCNRVFRSPRVTAVHVVHASRSGYVREAEIPWMEAQARLAGNVGVCRLGRLALGLVLVAGIAGAGYYGYASGWLDGEPEPLPLVVATPSPMLPVTSASTPTVLPSVAPTSTPTLVPTPVPSPDKRHLEHKRYMLSLINEERAAAGVESVVLGDNVAAQVHAETSLANCVASHWGVDGLKPYMRYSLAGGVQSNGENVSGLDYCIRPSDGYMALGSIESEIRDAMAGWVSSPGHRVTLLDSGYRKVNIGLAWDSYNRMFVQHFEGDHVRYESTPQIHEGRLSFTGRVIDGQGFAREDELDVQLNYDPPPHELTRGQLSRTYCYDYGAQIAAFLRPLIGGWSLDEDSFLDSAFTPCADPYEVAPDAPAPRSANEALRLLDDAVRQYEQAWDTGPDSGPEVRIPYVTATEWIAGGMEFRFAADVGELLSEHGPGVYTVHLWKVVNGEGVIISQYSIFHEVSLSGIYG